MAATKAESAADFLARPPSSRAETLVGGQGQPLGSRAELDAAFDNALAKVIEDPELVAADWTRYRLVPRAVEFFQADPDRKHVRLRYVREAPGWRTEERWP